MRDFKTIQCSTCYQKVALTDPVTNTCSCGTDYNGFGQKLAPREQWGWETGENLIDIYNGNDDW
jgi:hypothetical protein